MHDFFLLIFHFEINCEEFKLNFLWKIPSDKEYTGTILSKMINLVTERSWIHKTDPVQAMGTLIQPLIAALTLPPTLKFIYKTAVNSRVSL